MKTTVVALAAVLCSCATIGRPPAEITPISGAGWEGVIFSADYDRKTFFKYCRSDLWTPTRAQVLRFEKEFPGYLRRRKQSFLSVLPTRKRQYIGMADEARRPFMNVALLCGDDSEWKNRPAFAADGGDCNCRARFDPASSQVTSFGCAGYARSRREIARSR